MQSCVYFSQYKGLCKIVWGGRGESILKMEPKEAEGA